MTLFVLEPWKFQQNFINNKSVTCDQVPPELTELISARETVDRKKNSDRQHYECEICHDSSDKKTGCY